MNTITATNIVTMMLEIADNDSLVLDDACVYGPAHEGGVLRLYVTRGGQRLEVDCRWLTAQVWRSFKRSPSQAAVRQAEATLRALARYRSELPA